MRSEVSSRYDGVANTSAPAVPDPLSEIAMENLVSGSREAKQSGSIPWVGFEDGEVAFTDGRRRNARLRDQGTQSMPIAADPAIPDQKRRRFGTTARA